MKNFFIAARPKTLPASVIPPLMAYIYFYSTTHRHEWFYLSLCLLGALAIQLATNFFNDVIDHERGADKKRVGPTRVSASGLENVEKVKTWAKVMIVVTILCGIPIILRGGLFYLLFGFISLFLTYGYTGGRISLAYRGLGELFVFIFFGLFSVIGSYFLYADSFIFTQMSEVYALGSIFGLLTMALIMVNNLRDRIFDAEVGKKTLATRMPDKIYRFLTIFVIYLPYGLLLGFFHYRFMWLMLLALPPALKLTGIVLKDEGSDLNEGLKFAGLHLIFYSIFLSFVFIYGNPI